MTNTQNDYDAINAEIRKTDRLIEKIQNRYNPENDCRRGEPLVDWAEMDLAEAVQELGKAILTLKDKVATLEAQISITEE